MRSGFSSLGPDSPRVEPSMSCFTRALPLMMAYSSYCSLWVWPNGVRKSGAIL